MVLPSATDNAARRPDDATIATMVRAAHLPSLLAALAHATGDLSLLRDDLRPDPARAQEPHGGLSPEQRRAIRDLAVDVLGRGLPAEAPAPPDAAALRRMMEFALGATVTDDYFRLLVEELALSEQDLRAPGWQKGAIDPDRHFRVVVVGAGMSGLLAAHRLHQAGVPVVVLEKNPDVGGTWFENRYPGCRVDVPNHLYSYSFAQRRHWPQRFSTQEVLLDYFRACADDLAVRPDIRFGTEVVACRLSGEHGDWEITMRTPAGEEETIRADAVISAVGQLNRPSFPAIEGRHSFAGPSFHSARWDHDVDLTGRRVAVIGTGASGIQLVPAIAGRVSRLEVFQRTPNWFMPTPDYHDPTPEGMEWLLDHVPSYGRWYRLSLFWRLTEGALPAARVDPGWEGDGGSVSALSHQLRTLLTAYLQSQFADAPNLVDHVVPRYPPLAKRILLDNGTWAAALKRPNVSLVTADISCITPAGVVTDDGVLHEVDVIVYATGFEASRFLTPMRVFGRGGIELNEQWDGDARAYLGITVPGFPNLFCLYGPNTNLVANGSIIFFSECEVSYVLSCVRTLLERRAQSLDCRRDVHERYNTLVDEGNRRMAWGASTVNSWYKNARGRVTQNWPFTLLEFWQRTREVDPADYEFLGAGVDLGASRSSVMRQPDTKEEIP
jgi:4-hydroxyacetophenone monooxygenase